MSPREQAAAAQLVRRWRDVYRLFTRPRPLSIEEVVRLAPAVAELVADTDAFLDHQPAPTVQQ